MNTQSIRQPDPESKGDQRSPHERGRCIGHRPRARGVEVVFAYPGGASMELHQSLTALKKLELFFPDKNRRALWHGYARATGKAGVCMATSGLGATNLVTCIADAYMDSVPLVAITGQVYQQFIGKAAFQKLIFLV